MDQPSQALGAARPLRPRAARQLGWRRPPVLAAAAHLASASPVWALASLLIGPAAGRPCPPEGQARSVDLGTPKIATVTFENEAGVDVQLFWAGYDGIERQPVFIGSDNVMKQDTYPGHMFRVRASGSNRLLLTYQIPNRPSGQGGNVVKITACDGMDRSASVVAESERWPEFEALVHDAAAPCLGPSSNWSCVRSVSPEEVAQRKPELYGYHADELGSTNYRVGQTVDHNFGWQAKYILNVTAFEGGYLKMEMTDRLKKILYPWYSERKKDAVEKHQEIPGGFTNNHRAFFDIIHLGKYPGVKSGIMQEMKAVLEWWTKMRLRHSETFGVRIYRRDAMLVNHLDRQDTHVASAVLQVGQKVDEDGGWPLEVIHPHRPGRKEVYLQPGQMVLYEGARIVHGRPMRFKGKEFGNIFTHFAPLSWYGLDHGRPNPHFEEHPDLHKNEL